MKTKSNLEHPTLPPPASFSSAHREQGKYSPDRGEEYLYLSVASPRFCHLISAGCSLPDRASGWRLQCPQRPTVSTSSHPPGSGGEKTREVREEQKRGRARDKCSWRRERERERERERGPQRWIRVKAWLVFFRPACLCNTDSHTVKQPDRPPGHSLSLPSLAVPARLWVWLNTV